LRQLTHLKIVELPRNQITDISVLKVLSSLKYLQLDNNPISDADKQSLKYKLVKQYETE
jgi:hypothetical protein